MKRVLLGSMPVGGGHHALRDSFLASLQAADPSGVQFEPVTFNSQDTRVADFYELCVKRAPWFQGLLYEMGRYRWGARATVLTNGPLLQEAKQALLQHRPDVVVSTHFLLSMMFVKARRALGLEIPVVSAIPDYGETVELFYPEIEELRADYTIVMDRKTQQQLLYKRHHPPSRLLLGGFVPRAGFLEVARAFDGDFRLPGPRRLELIAQLKAEHPQFEHFDPAKKTLIVLGGSAWAQKTLPVIELLLRRPRVLAQLNVIVVSGKNELFHQALQTRVARNPRVSVFGFVPPGLMARLQAVSDIPVLGSLAPASMHELLEMRCGPLMLFHFIPGTENPHVDYIHDQHLGAYEPDPEQMVGLLQEVLGLIPARPEVAQLVRSFPRRALAIRTDQVERAGMLAPFLAGIGQVVPLHSATSARGPARELELGRSQVS